MRFLKLVLAAALIAAPITATPAVAAPPPVNKVDTEAEVGKVLGDIIAWAGGYNQLISESNDFSFELIDVVAETVEDKRTGEEGRAWMTAWLAKADAEIARQRAALAALPPMPAELARRYGAMGPAAARQIEGFRTLPSITKGVIDGAATLLNRLRPLLIKAASGDAEAKFAVARQTVAGTVLALRNENAMLDLQVVMANRPDHPQIGLSKAAKASNEASIIVLEYMDRQANGEEPDPVAAGKAMQAKVATGRAEARTVWPNAQKLKAEFNTSLPAGPFRTAFYTALDTFEESGRIELALADQLGRMADRLASGAAEADPDGTSFNGIEPLVNQRTALYRRRTELFKTR